MPNKIIRNRWIILAVFLILLLGGWSTYSAREHAEKSERRDLENRASIAAAAIDQEELRSLSGSPVDLANPDYHILKGVMGDIKSVSGDMRFVYLTGIRDDMLYFIVDSEDPGTDGYSAPGDIYTDTSPTQIAHYKNGTPFVEGPYTDSFGEWVTGWVPLVDNETGQTVAMLGMDIAADTWQERVHGAMILPAVITLFLLIFLFAYYYLSQRKARYLEAVRESEQRLRTLYEIGTKPHLDIASQFREALQTGKNTLHTRMAMLNRIEGDKFTVLYAMVPPNTLHEGDVFSLAETYCDITVKTNDVVAISAMKLSTYKAHVCYSKFGLESYIGTPVKVSGKLFGTLTFLSPDPHHPEFSESDKDFVRLMGNWMGATLERQEIDRMKSEFVSVASHQLRTPLTGIKWFGELLLKGKAGVLTPDQTGFIKEMYESNNRMINLVEDLLNVSRIETGTKFVITKAPTDIVPIVDSLSTDLVGLAHAHEVTIKKTSTFPSSLTLNIDTDKIRQVFGNLMSNAVKYSKAGGMVEIGFEEKSKDNHDMYVFSIRDTGLGIPENAKKRVFEKFFRADNVQTHETDGTGLGLYIAKAIAEGHGGTLWFESKENEGTTFLLSLPKK